MEGFIDNLEFKIIFKVSPRSVRHLGAAQWETILVEDQKGISIGVVVFLALEDNGWLIDCRIESEGNRERGILSIEACYNWCSLYGLCISSGKSFNFQMLQSSIILVEALRRLSSCCCEISIFLKLPICPSSLVLITSIKG